MIMPTSWALSVFLCVCVCVCLYRGVISLSSICVVGCMLPLAEAKMQDSLSSVQTVSLFSGALHSLLMVVGSCWLCRKLRALLCSFG
jgi:hypothetical protein